MAHFGSYSVPQTCLDGKPKGFGQRHILAFMGFLGFALSYALRFSLSIAIVAMVKGSNTMKPSQNIDEILFAKDVCTRNLDIIRHNQSLNIDNQSNIYAFVPLEIENNKTLLEHDINRNISINNLMYVSANENFSSSVDEIDEGEFDWSESQQGFILGAFFWGYIFMQIPGGYLSHRFGGKWPLCIAVFFPSLLHLLTPVLSRWGDFHAIVTVRILQGLTGGIAVPSMHGLLAKWVPPGERGRMTSIVYAGMNFGNALSLVVSGYIINYFGWPAVFYVLGSVSILWCIVWVLLIQNEPSQHSRITQEELKYIQNSIKNGATKNGNKRPPWGKILRSKPFWAIVFGQLTETWGLYTIMADLPTYMKTVLHYDIKENSLLSALPHILTWITGMSIASIGDFFIEKRYASIGTVRKTCNTIGMWGAAAALLGVAYSGCDRTITVSLICLAVSASGGVLGGVLVNLMDICPSFAGILMGFTNTAGNIPGIFAPLVAGIIIDKDPSLARWRIVFMIASAIYFVGNSLFIMLASGEEQPWNNEGESDNESANNEGQEKIPSNINLQQIDLVNLYLAPLADAVDPHVQILNGEDSSSYHRRNFA